MTAVAGELHWAQQAGSVPGAIVRPATIEEAAHAYAADPALRPVAGGTDLLLELAPSGVVEGEVRREDGSPAQGVVVRVVDEHENPLQIWSDHETDFEGRFRFPDAGPGAYTVVAVDEDGNEAREEIVLRAGETVWVSVSF